MSKKNKDTIQINKQEASASGSEASRALLVLMGIKSIRCKCGTLNLGGQNEGALTTCKSCEESLED